MKFKGLKIGIIFFVLSILLTLTFVGPIFISMFVESVGKSIDELLGVGNISGTTFYVCIAACTTCFCSYVFSLIKYRQNSLAWLIVLFISFFIFLNAGLLYYDIRFPDSHIDGQQAFESIDTPVKTCLLYLIIGIGHDFIIDKYDTIDSRSTVSQK